MMQDANPLSFFKEKTVTLLGLGLLGRGVGDAAFLARYCRNVFVTDMKSADELRVSIDALKEFNNIEFYLGGHDEKIFSGVDFIVKGAGVRLDNPYVAIAHAQGIPVYMSTALFAYLAPIKCIGITGTRGKTTTTCMIVDILKKAGKKVLLGGNIRGISTLALLPETDQYDIAVLELDSWQLQGFDALGLSPHISVFTNFYPDHMNYYDGDMDRYLRDKTAIFRHQKPGDILVTTQHILDLSNTGRKDGVVIASSLPDSYMLKIPGTHNRANAALALAAARAYGIDEATINAALHDFSAVEGRLQYVGAWNQRAFYNDNNATTQEATLAALGAFSASSIVLIFGGSDKGLPIDRLVSFISSNEIRCVLIKGAGSDRVLEKLSSIPTVGTMSEAIQTATALSKPNDNIILSPAFASFGAFKNEYDRSDQFLREVQKLIAASPQK